MKQVGVLTNRKWRSQEHVADIFMLFIFKGWYKAAGYISYASLTQTYFISL